MNRDELHTRGPAHPPSEGVSRGVRYLAPTDSDAGGSWIGVNEHGLTACLLNNYPRDTVPPSPPAPGDEYTSRGRLLVSALSCHSCADVALLLVDEQLANFRPFFLFALDADRTPRLFRWDGQGSIVERADPSPPVTTSSFDSERVIGTRAALFQSRFGGGGPGLRAVGAAPTSPALAAYHRSHDPARGAYSVCMHRDDAGTKSLSHITVRIGSGRIDFSYTPGPPCERAESSLHQLTMS